jgi:hypothetical protein
LVISPAVDREFAEFAEEQLRSGSGGVTGFAARLRARYPEATVHPRELSGELPIWYTYRDGYWTPSGTRRR